MNRHLFLFVLLVCSCSGVNPVVEYPSFLFRSDTDLEITKIERTDTATIVAFESFKNPDKYSCFRNAYLLSGGVRYVLRSEEFCEPIKGSKAFRLMFEPIPASAREVSFLEGDNLGDIWFFHIDLSGKQPGSHPARNLSREKIPEVSFESGKTTVVMSTGCPLAGLPHPMASLYVNSLFPPEQYEYVAQMDDDGNASFEFWQNGVAECWIAFGNNAANPFFTKPGETVKVHLDAGFGAETREHFGLNETRGAEFMVDGEYGALSESLKGSEAYFFDLYGGSFAKEATTASEYMQYVRCLYEEKMHSIESDRSLAAIQKYSYGLMVKKNVIAAIIYCDYIKRHPITFSDSDLEWLAGLGLDNPGMAFLSWFYLDLADPSQPFLRFANPDGNGFIAELPGALPYLEKLNDGIFLTPEEITDINKFNTPMLRDGLNELQRQLETASIVTEGICETPDVPAGELVDAILERYKGKPVLIDFWATWCSPCRLGIREIEPLKETRYKDVCFVYITGTTSPRNKWLEMIPDIHGEHYYLEEDQLKTIFNQLETNVYPSYLIVGRDGLHKDFVKGYYKKRIFDALDEILK